jgi:uncharacterized protein YjiS (DUF1127 family)
MFVAFIVAKIRAYWRYQESVRELSRLSDRELEDIGVSRIEIDTIARQHSVS